MPTAYELHQLAFVARPRLPPRLESAGTILTIDADCSIINDGSILVSDGLIKYVGPRRQEFGLVINSRFDAKGKAILPGFINSHTHLCMTFGRTIAVERDLLSWLGTATLSNDAPNALEYLHG